MYTDDKASSKFSLIDLFNNKHYRKISVFRVHGHCKAPQGIETL